MEASQGGSSRLPPSPAAAGSLLSCKYKQIPAQAAGSPHPTPGQAGLPLPQPPPGQGWRRLRPHSQVSLTASSPAAAAAPLPRILSSVERGKAASQPPKNPALGCRRLPRAWCAPSPSLLQACPSRGSVRCAEQGPNTARIRQQPDSQPQPLIRAGGQAALGMRQPARVQGAGRPTGPICPRPPPHRSPLGAVMTQPDLGLGLGTGQLPPTPLSSLPRSLRREE